MYNDLEKASNVCMKTGEVIKYLRKNFNMTQEELTTKLRVNISQDDST